MNSADQAAGLRHWAGVAAGGQPQEESGSNVDSATRNELRTLMVVGLPDTSSRQVSRVAGVIAQWAEQGSRWVGDPGSWRVVPIDPASPYLSTLATEQQRWALWVETDADGFRHGYAVLKQIAFRHGPARLLALHPPGVSRRGLLDNLQKAAAAYLNIELVVLAR